MSVDRAWLRSPSNALMLRMSSKQICLQVSPKLFGVNTWTPQMIRQWIPDYSARSAEGLEALMRMTKVNLAAHSQVWPATCQHWTLFCVEPHSIDCGGDCGDSYMSACGSLMRIWWSVYRAGQSHYNILTTLTSQIAVAYNWTVRIYLRRLGRFSAITVLRFVFHATHRAI